MCGVRCPSLNQWVVYDAERLISPLLRLDRRDDSLTTTTLDPLNFSPGRRVESAAANTVHARINLVRNQTAPKRVVGWTSRAAFYSGLRRMQHDCLGLLRNRAFI